VIGILVHGFLDFNLHIPAKRRAVLRSLRNRRLQTAAGIAAAACGSPTQSDRGTHSGNRGILIDSRVAAC
jgi:hypothetical protein